MLRPARQRAPVTREVAVRVQRRVRGKERSGHETFAGFGPARAPFLRSRARLNGVLRPHVRLVLVPRRLTGLLLLLRSSLRDVLLVVRRDALRPLEQPVAHGAPLVPPGRSGERARDFLLARPRFFLARRRFPPRRRSSPRASARERLAAGAAATFGRRRARDRAFRDAAIRDRRLRRPGTPEPPSLRVSSTLGRLPGRFLFFFFRRLRSPRDFFPGRQPRVRPGARGGGRGDTGHGPPCAPSSPPSFLAQTCRTSPSRSTSADETAYPSSLSVTAVASHARPRSATIASASGARGAERERAGGRYHTQRFSGARRSTGIRRASMLRRRRAAFPRSASFPRSAGKWGVDGDAVVGIVCVRYP